MVTAFPLDIFVFLSLPCASEVYLHCWNFLEGYPSQDKVHFTDIRQVREDNPLGLMPLNICLLYHLLWGLSQCCLLLGRVIISEWGFKPNAKAQVLAPTINYKDIKLFLQKKKKN